MALVDQYSKEELSQIVDQSTSLKEVIFKLGYSTVSGNCNTVKNRIEEYEIDCSHFSLSTSPINYPRQGQKRNSASSDLYLLMSAGMLSCKTTCMSKLAIATRVSPLCTRLTQKRLLVQQERGMQYSTRTTRIIVGTSGKQIPQVLIS